MARAKTAKQIALRIKQLKRQMTSLERQKKKAATRGKAKRRTTRGRTTRRTARRRR